MRPNLKQLSAAVHVTFASAYLCVGIIAVIAACHFAISTLAGKQRYRELNATPRMRWWTQFYALLLTIFLCFAYM